MAKLYAADPRKAERGGFVELLRDLLVDGNATVVANAVAALSEIADRPDGVVFKLNLQIANKLIAALGESSEWVTVCSVRSTGLLGVKMGPDLYPRRATTLRSRNTRRR